MTMMMRPSEIPVLLTSSVVAYDTRVRLKDTDERIRLAMESIAQWLRLNPSQPLVLCDGSNFDFTEITQKEFPSASIECLPFENNQTLVEKNGRGYGEGEIVRYALQHSTYISKAQCFAKCSSKLWVENFAACAQAWRGDLLLQGVFLNVFQPWKPLVFSYIDTRFYIANVELYKKFFENAHLLINKKEKFGLENAFHKIVLEQKIQNALSPVAPVIGGMGGTIANYYDTSLRRRFKDALRLKIVTRAEKYKTLFIAA